jgi:uncharacterized protein (DUF433 family)
METRINIPDSTYRLLKKRADEMQTTPEKVAEAILRQQLGNSVHIEQRPTPSGPQAYLRGTRVAVRHVAAFLKAGRTAEEIAKDDLPHLPAAAIYEAIAYYFDHQKEVDAEIQANELEVTQTQLKRLLSPEQYSRLTGQG